MKTEKAAAVFLGVSLFAASSGLTNAYLTEHPKAIVNLISSGSVDVELTEPAWQPENALGLVPGSVVPKNPTATNTGKSDAWIFLRVSVPVKCISVVNPQTHRKEPPADIGIFSFLAAEGWERITAERTADSINFIQPIILQYVPLHNFREIVKPGEKTAPLFESVTLVNYLEGELTASDILQIPVEAVAVQDHVCEPGAALTEIYEVYLAEESGSI